VKNCKFFSQKKSIIENVLNSSFYNEGFFVKTSWGMYSTFHVTEVSTSFANKGLKPLAYTSF